MSSKITSFPPPLHEKINILSFIPHQSDADISLETNVSSIGDIVDRDSQRFDLVEYYQAIDRDLTTLLQLPRDIFWAIASQDSSFGIFLDSYFLNIKSYSIQGDPNGVVSSSLLGESLNEMIPLIKKKVFRVVARLSLQQEHPSLESIPKSMQGNILYDGFVIYPHALVDFCSIYSAIDFQRTQAIVRNIIASHSGYIDDLHSVMSSIVESIVQIDRQLLLSIYPDSAPSVLPARLKRGTNNNSITTVIPSNPLHQFQVSNDISSLLPETYTHDTISLLSVLTDILWSLHSTILTIPISTLNISTVLADYNLLPTLARLVDYTLASVALHLHLEYQEYRSDPVFSNILSLILQISTKVLSDGVFYPLLLTSDSSETSDTNQQVDPYRTNGSVEKRVQLVKPDDVKRFYRVLASISKPVRPVLLPPIEVETESGEIEILDDIPNPILVKAISKYESTNDDFVIDTNIYDYDIEEEIISASLPKYRAGSGDENESHTTVDYSSENMTSFTDFGSFLFFVQKIISITNPIQTILTTGMNPTVSTVTTTTTTTTTTSSTSTGTTNGAMLKSKLHEKIGKALKIDTLEKLLSSIQQAQDDFVDTMVAMQKQFTQAGLSETGKYDPFSHSLSSSSSSSISSSEKSISTDSQTNAWKSADVSLGQKSTSLQLSGMSRPQLITRYNQEITSFQSFFPDYSQDFIFDVLEHFKFDVNKAVNGIFEQQLPFMLQNIPEVDRAAYTFSTSSSSSSSTSAPAIAAARLSEEEEFQRKLSQMRHKQDAKSAALLNEQKMNTFENEHERSLMRDRLAHALIAQAEAEAAAEAAEAMYQDEYDDTFDSYATYNADFKAEEGDEHDVGTTSRRNKSRQSQDGNDDDDDDEETNNNKYRGPQRTRGGAVAGSKQKFKGSENMSDHDKHNKEKNKARLANHNRKKQAAKKNTI